MEVALLLLCLLIGLLATCAFTADEAASSGRIGLAGCALVLPDGQPGYVSYAASDLAQFLSELAESKVQVLSTPDPTASVLILVGPELAAQVPGFEVPSAELLGEQGLCLRATHLAGQPVILAFGRAPQGTRNALAELARRIQVDSTGPWLEAPLDLTSKPSFAMRGLHFNGWAFDSPYTFRNWTEQEWQRFIDVLGCQQVNLLYIWPFMEIIPLPLSKEDRAYLEEVNRIVQYAQQRHGMEVWLMQAANRVAQNDLGVADPRKRPYWRPAVQVDLNPGDPAARREVMASHEALYSVVTSADGICTIDSDPGGYPASPLSEYMAIFTGCRELLDQTTDKGKQTKLINWMWFGWGVEWTQGFNPEHCAATIQAMKDSVPEPWWLVAGIPAYLPKCQQAGVLGKTVYLPYNTIEAEPSYPGTNPGLTEVNRVFEGLDAYPELVGMMGNTQCPVLQLPRIYQYLQCEWDPARHSRSEAEVLREATRLLYPEHSELIAECYEALPVNEAARLESLVEQLGSLLETDGLGKPGLIGRKLFPTPNLVAEALLMQLRLRLALARLYADLAPTREEAVALQLYRDVFTAYLTWDDAHGWHRLWGDGTWPLGRFGVEPAFERALGNLRLLTGDEAGLASFLVDLGASLTGEFSHEVVQKNALEPLQQAAMALLLIPPNLATSAQATASVMADEGRYPPEYAVDGLASSLFWPGALVKSNEEWLQLAWDEPRYLRQVTVYFLKHPSMQGRTIRLQRETTTGLWEDLATCQPREEGNFSLARFLLPEPTTLSALRIVNLLDVFEVVVE